MYEVWMSITHEGQEVRKFCLSANHQSDAIDYAKELHKRNVEKLPTAEWSVEKDGKRLFLITGGRADV